MGFIQQIQEVLDGNGWGEWLLAEELPPPGPPGWEEGKMIVRVRRVDADPEAIENVVGVYVEGVTSAEQVQYEAYRYLRTGHTGAMG